MAELKIIFTNGDAIEANDISAEDNLDIIKTFSVENKTKNDYKYNVVIESLLNTFKTTGFLVYKITSDDGGYNMTEFEDVPKSSSTEILILTYDFNKPTKDVVLAYNINIPAKSIHNYKIEIKYIYDEENSQDEDQGATLSGKLFIGEGYRTLVSAMLEDNPTVLTRTDFSTANTEDTTGKIYVQSSTATSKMTEDTDGDGIGEDTYYYSGNTTNNWVKFGKVGKLSCTYNGVEVTYISDYDDSNADKINNLTEAECTSTNVCNVNDESYYVGITEEQCATIDGIWTSSKATYTEPKDIYWRIIRTTEPEFTDITSSSGNRTFSEFKSIKLLYVGTSPDTTDGFIDISKFNEQSDDPMYVGYKYGTSSSLANNRTNTNNSLVYYALSNFLDLFDSSGNVLSKYQRYISFSNRCNDRSTIYDSYSLNNSFYYGVYVRLNEFYPTYKCGGDGNGGLFETTQAAEDNLFDIIGLMTADEVSFAGGVVGKNNSSAWYNTNSEGNSVTNNKSWWTMSPFGYNPITDGSSTLAAFNYNVSSTGSIEGSVVTNELYVRPVISIPECMAVTGKGTPKNPYVIDYSNSCYQEIMS